jgi:hypothetical protein
VDEVEFFLGGNQSNEEKQSQHAAKFGRVPKAITARNLYRRNAKGRYGNGVDVIGV